jgi:hypothetical protein
VWETLRCGLYDEEIINLHVDPDERNVFILLNNLVFERAPLYRAFPEDFTTKLPKEVRDILLFARRGRESLFWTGHLFKQLLKGECLEFTAILCNILTSRRTIRRSHWVGV